MNKLEVEQHIRETTEKVKAHKALIASLETQSENVAAQGDAKKVVAAKKELTAARELLEGLELVLKAYQKKATEFKERREPEAAKIRTRLAEVWIGAVSEYEKLTRLHGELQSILAKIAEFNDTMATLTKHHNELMGDAMQIPQLSIPNELFLAGKAKFDVAPPKTLDTRVASLREEERLADLFKEQEPEVAKILKRAGQAWPNCPACGARMLAQRQGPNDPAYGISEDGKRAFANFRCQKHSQWTRNIVFPPPPPAPGPRYPIPEDSAPVQSVFAVPPRNDGHGLADQPGLTNQNNKGGKKAT